MKIKKLRFLIAMAWKYLMNRPFATVISIMAIGVSLIFLVAVGTINFAITKAATQGAVKYPLIISSEASSGIRTIMSTIFHVDKPAGTIPFSAFEKIRNDDRVSAAYPVAVADNYRSFPVVGVNRAFLDDLGAGTVRGSMDISENSHVVVGYTVAEKTGLRVGDTFYGSHGMVGTAHTHEHKELKYEVRGILERMNRPEDSSIFSRYQAVWYIHDMHLASHHHEHHKDVHADEQHGDAHDDGGHAAYGEHDAEKEHHHKKKKLMLTSGTLTAVLVRTRSPAYTGQLEREWSLASGTQAVDTGRTIRKIVQYLNKAEDIVSMFTGLFLAIVVVMIMVTIVMSLNERRKELALMRSLGIGQFTIASIVMLESLMLTGFGAFIGFVLGHLSVWWAERTINSALQISLEPFQVTAMELNGLIITLVAGQCLALLSMIWTYRMNIVTEIARD